jgi:hypothetical protein
MGVLDELRTSQEAETALYARLKAPGLSDSERASLIQQINAQSAVRTEAYSKLTKAYSAQRHETALVTDATKQQLEAMKLVEEQLNRTKTAMADKRLETLKLNEITAYTGQQYQAYASFLASLAGVMVLFIVAGWLSPRLARRGVPFTAWLPRLVLLAGVIHLIMRAFDLLLRRNDMFDEYAWPVAPRTLDGLDKANAQTSKIINVDGLPTLCAGSYCCADGTEWVDAKGCVVSASPPKKSKSESTLGGQELTKKVKSSAKSFLDDPQSVF